MRVARSLVLWLPYSLLLLLHNSIILLGSHSNIFSLLVRSTHPTPEKCQGASSPSTCLVSYALPVYPCEHQHAARPKYHANTCALQKLPFKNDETNNLPPGVSLPHAMQPMDPESPGEIPKTIVPLPNDLDSALRAACTGVVRNNKPSHEYHKNGKAQLDYATIRRGGGTVKAAKRPERPEHPPASLAKTTSNEERLQQQQAQQQMQGPLSAGLSSPGTSQRMSHISASADVQPQHQNGETQGRQQRSRAQSRADQLMGGASPPKAPAPKLLRDRTDSHSRSQSTPQPSWTLPPPKITFDRPKPQPRAHSMEGSTTNTESPNTTWSAATAITSGLNAPARSSSLRKPARSGTEVQNAMKVDAIDAEWMREESERRRLLQQQAYAEAMASRHATWIAPKKEQEDASKEQNTAPAEESQVPAPVASVPSRKPVGSARRESHQEPQTNSDHDFEASSPELDLSLDDPARFESSHVKYEEPQQSDSRTGRGRTRGTNVPMNSRAASRARSITREVKDFMRNASRHRQPREHRSKQDEPQSRSRRPSLSRTRDAAANVIDYFRPGTATGGTKQSLDIPRNGSNLMSKSHESLVSATSATSAAKDTPMQPNSQRSSQQPKRPSVYADARSRNSTEADEEERDVQRDSAGSEPPHTKRQVDLNRALPPLPRLDSYQVDDTANGPTQTEEFIQPPKQVLQPPHPAQQSGLTSPTLKKTTSRDPNRSPLPSPKLPEGAGVHDFVALRMGAPVPVSRQSSRAKMPRDQMNPNLVHQARPRGKRQPTDPRYSQIRADPSSLQSPSQMSLANRESARRRSKSLQEVNAPDLSEKLRKASANAPDGKPIRAVGQAKLIDTSPAPKENDGFASKLGRKLSTRARGGKRNITPTPPPPPPHQELPQRSAKTATNTPGLSRTNSDYRSENRRSLSRKMSMEEYGRMYDGRYHKHNATLTAPPPVAVHNPKSSPRMGLGNFLPHKYTPQQHHQSPQQGGPKKWWHLGLGGSGDKDTPMDEVSRANSSADHAAGGLGVRY